MGKLKDTIMWPYDRDRSESINQHIRDTYFKIHKNKIYNPPKNKYNIIGDRVEECREVTVHSFTMGDVEDPDLYAAQPLFEWQQSEQGQWIMNNAADVPIWHRLADNTGFGYKYIIKAKLMGPALTEWLLRYGK
jgi:hypothetical protein